MLLAGSAFVVNDRVLSNMTHALQAVRNALICLAETLSSRQRLKDTLNVGAAGVDFIRYGLAGISYGLFVICVWFVVPGNRLAFTFAISQ